MEFKPRLTRPEQGNKYYITKGAGGYSRAIVGKPTDKYCNVLSNCVGYADGRFHEIAKRVEMDYFDPVNAENIYENAQAHGMKVGSEPKLGAAIVWEGIGSAAGHIAIVEQINSDGSIVTSESGWNCANPFWTQKRTNSNGNWGAGSGYKFKGFIYQPEEVEPEPKPEPKRAIKRGMQGQDVKDMQAALALAGYLRVSEIDGDFGNITLGALLAFQYDNKLAIDGVCGPATKKALKID